MKVDERIKGEMRNANVGLNPKSVFFLSLSLLAFCGLGHLFDRATWSCWCRSLKPCRAEKDGRASGEIKAIQDMDITRRHAFCV